MKSQSHRPTVRPSVFLGGDAGGSHSAVAIGREDGTVLGRAEGPGAAMRPGGAAASAVVLADIARRAATQATVSLPVDRAVVGAAGAGRAQEQQELAAPPAAAGHGNAPPGGRARAPRAERGLRGGGVGAADPERRGRGARNAGARPRALLSGSGRDTGRPCGRSPVRHLATRRGAAADARGRNAAGPAADRARGYGTRGAEARGARIDGSGERYVAVRRRVPLPAPHSRSRPPAAMPVPGSPRAGPTRPPPAPRRRRRSRCRTR